MKLRFCDIIERRQVQPMELIQCPLNGNGYLRLTAACLRQRRQVQPNPSLGIEDFVRRFAKGSKPFRKTIERSRATVSLQNTRTYANFLRISTLNQEQHGQFIEHGWTLSGLYAVPNTLREFAFHFYNNTLPINTRVSHFVPNQQRGCDLCNVRGIDPIPDETFQHVFFTCGFAIDVLRKFCREILGLDRDIDGTEWATDIGGTDLPSAVIKMIAFYLIWRCKELKKWPSWNTFKWEYVTYTRNVFDGNKKLKYAKINSVDPICRNFANG